VGVSARVMRIRHRRRVVDQLMIATRIVNHLSAAAVYSTTTRRASKLYEASLHAGGSCSAGGSLLTQGAVAMCDDEP